MGDASGVHPVAPVRRRAGRGGRPEHEAPFVDAAAAERSRTGPPANLGPNYSKVSQPLWTAIQAALTRRQISPQDALDRRLSNRPLRR